jgi:hypothetical protein
MCCYCSWIIPLPTLPLLLISSLWLTIVNCFNCHSSFAALVFAIVVVLSMMACHHHCHCLHHESTNTFSFCHFLVFLYTANNQRGRVIVGCMAKVVVSPHLHWTNTCSLQICLFALSTTTTTTSSALTFSREFDSIHLAGDGRGSRVFSFGIV